MLKFRIRIEFLANILRKFLINIKQKKKLKINVTIIYERLTLFRRVYVCMVLFVLFFFCIKLLINLFLVR